jgi:hypothetical protein
MNVGPKQVEGGGLRAEVERTSARNSTLLCEYSI